eukprot:gene8918-9870_t
MQQSNSKQDCSKNPKAGYSSFFTNYKQEESQVSSKSGNNIRYPSAIVKGNSLICPQQRPLSEPAFTSSVPSFSTKPKQQHVDWKDPQSSRGSTEGGSRRDTASDIPLYWCSDYERPSLASGSTDVEWDKQRVKETNMEWRQGYEKWRTRAGDVMQGYARELEKSLREHPDALLKCP